MPLINISGKRAGSRRHRANYSVYDGFRQPSRYSRVKPSKRNIAELDSVVRVVDLFVPAGTTTGEGCPCLVISSGFTSSRPIPDELGCFRREPRSGLDRLIGEQAHAPRLVPSRLLHPARRQPITSTRLHGCFGGLPAVLRCSGAPKQRFQMWPCRVPGAAACSAKSLWLIRRDHARSAPLRHLVSGRPVISGDMGSKCAICPTCQRSCATRRAENSIEKWWQGSSKQPKKHPESQGDQALAMAASYDAIPHKFLDPAASRPIPAR